MYALQRKMQSTYKLVSIEQTKFISETTDLQSSLGRCFPEKSDMVEK